MKKIMFTLLLTLTPFFAYSFPDVSKIPYDKVDGILFQKNFIKFQRLKINECRYFQTFNSETGYEIFIWDTDDMLDSFCGIRKSKNEDIVWSKITKELVADNSIHIYVFGFNEGSLTFCKETRSGGFCQNQVNR